MVLIFLSLPFHLSHTDFHLLPSALCCRHRLHRVGGDRRGGFDRLGCHLHIGAAKGDRHIRGPLPQNARYEQTLLNLSGTDLKGN